MALVVRVRLGALLIRDWLDTDVITNGNSMPRFWGTSRPLTEYFQLPPCSENNIDLCYEMSQRGGFIAILRHFQRCVIK